jgi:hypothetical protein
MQKEKGELSLGSAVPGDAGRQSPVDAIATWATPGPSYVTTTPEFDTSMLGIGYALRNMMPLPAPPEAK